MLAPNNTALIAELKARATALGFGAFGITSAGARPDLRDKLQHALAEGWHGDMDWMAETAERRASPSALWDGARSIIMLGVNYGPDSDPLATLTERDRGTISVYARNRDYHEIIKGKLKELAGLLSRRSGAEVKVFVDTAPVMEKPLAAAAGLGWQGKHTNLVSRDHGSWLLLGAIYTTLDLAPNTPARDRCGSCSACQTACPTNAFPAPYQLDARRCISYLTIEHKGPIPPEFRSAIGNRVYGCDDCLAVCPWNKFAQSAHDLTYRPRAELVAPALADLLALDDAGFRAVFAGSPVKRIGRGRMVRNAAIAAGNSGDVTLIPVLQMLTADADAVVAEAAGWALEQLSAAPARVP